MSGGVGDVVHLAHDSSRVDEEADPAREWRGGVFADRAVGRSDCPVDVGQEAIREALCFRKCLVLLGRVEGDADDLGAGLGERGGSITEPLSFNRSARGGRLRVPPKDRPFAAEVVERQPPAGVVRQVERRREVAFGDGHPVTLVPVDGGEDLQAALVYRARECFVSHVVGVEQPLDAPVDIGLECRIIGPHAVEHDRELDR